MVKEDHAAEESSLSAASSLEPLNDNDNNSITGSQPRPPSTPPTKSSLFSRARELAAISTPSRLLRHRRRRARSLDDLRNRSSRVWADHFRVDYVDPNKQQLVKKKRGVVVLPGVPRYDSDWARDSHDFFNLVVLIPVVVLNVMCWNWDMLLSSRQSSLQDAWTGEWFGTFFTCTCLYFLIDGIWICVVPECVKSPTTILQHHVATLLYLIIPFRIAEFQWCMGACMMVEINTWLLIARRVFNKQGFPPWMTIEMSFISIRIKLISILFYLTWIGIRCLLYPYLMVQFVNVWLRYSESLGGRYINLVLLSVPLHAAFCILNLKWTIDLITSKIRYWRRCGFFKQVNEYKEQQQDKGL